MDAEGGVAVPGLSHRQRLAGSRLSPQVVVVVEGRAAVIAVGGAAGRSPRLASDLRTALLTIPHAVRSVEVAFADATDVSVTVTEVLRAGDRVARSVGARVLVRVLDGNVPPGLAGTAAPTHDRSA